MTLNRALANAIRADQLFHAALRHQFGPDAHPLNVNPSHYSEFTLYALASKMRADEQANQQLQRN